MKKQGPPPPLDETKISSLKKRKVPESDRTSAPGKKRRRAGDEIKNASKIGKSPVRLPLPLNGNQATQTKSRKPVKSAPLPLPESGSSDHDEADLIGDELDRRDRASDSSLDDLAPDDFGDLEDDDDEPEDSAFDSDEDQFPKARFSEDEDESDAEEKLTAANIAGLTRKLDDAKAADEAVAQQELEEAALQTNIAGDQADVFGDGEQSAPGLAPDLQLLRHRITETIRILGDLPTLGAPDKSRADYTSLLISDICIYYGYTPYLAEKLFSLFTPKEAFEFFEANESPRPVVIRTNTLRTNRRTLAQALINRGVVLEPVGKWSKVGLQVFESAVPLGATPEYLAGHYILQAASSFLPVMALAPQSNERILDMAAAPGGKTTYISALMRNTGCVMANDANRQRAKGLIGNIHRLGCKNTIISNLDARTEFPKVLGGFDRVLLDAPCSGTGVIAKDPSVKTSKTERDFLALPHMQKQLLLAAIDSTDHASKTGGYIVYSTCSVTVEENEGVVQYVLRKRPNVKIVDTGLGNFGSEGFKKYMNKRFDDKMNMARRYFPHQQNVDGFFVCKLKKVGPTPAGAGVVNGAGSTKVKHAQDGDDLEEFDTSIRDKAPVKEDEGEDEDDNFGGFDDEEDANYMARAERNRLRRKGINPKATLNGHSNGGNKKTDKKE